MSLDLQHFVICLCHAGGLVRWKSEPYRDRPLQPALRLPVGREFRQQLQRARQVNQVGFAGVVQQTPKRIVGQTELADVDGVLGDRIELRCVAAKPTLMRQRVGDVLDQDLGGIWVQRPEPEAGESADEAVATIHTVSGTRLAGSHNYPPPVPLPWGTKARSLRFSWRVMTPRRLQPRGHRDGAGGRKRPASFSTLPGGKGPRSAAEWSLRPGNEVFALLHRTGTGHCPVPTHRSTGFNSLGLSEFDSSDAFNVATWTTPLLLSLCKLPGVKLCTLFGVRARRNGQCVNLSPSPNVTRYIFATLKPHQIESLLIRCKTESFVQGISLPKIGTGDAIQAS